MNKINIAEILKDCPSGMELDCTLLEDLEFDGIVDNKYVPIRCRVKNPNGGYYVYNFTKYGCWFNTTFAKCAIFPKGKTTWEGFVPPCKFKDGDVVATKNGFFIGIVKIENGVQQSAYVAINGINNLSINISFRFERFTTEEEKSKLFQAIKDNGYKWNAETKTLEKLVEPKFKVGDIVCDDKRVYRIYDIDDTHYKSTYIQGGKSLCCFFPIHTQDRYRDVNCHFWVGDRITDQKKFIYLIKEVTLTGYILKDLKNTQITFEEARLYFVKVPDKFDITTLKPFDKVLVRETNEDRWLIDFYAFYNEIQEFSCVKGMYEQCIPYEGNEHLFLSFDDCDEYFKTWE